LSTIQAPFTYEALPPKDIVFAPLNRPGEVMDGIKLFEVLSEDRHLNKYLPIIKDSPVYPVILDKNRTVCSLPPIINGEHSKITLATRDIFIDMTATDEARLENALNILVAMFCEYCAEPFTIEPIKVVYPDGTSSIQPKLAPRKTTARLSYINSCTGLSLDTTQVSKFLNRMGHEARPSSSNPKEIVEVEIPSTRPDVLHECDLMEDVAVAYGFDNLPRRFPSTNTVAAPLPINKLSDLIRRECAYSGWTEVLPLILCSRDENFSSLRKKDDGSAITLENPKTAEYQVVRTSLLPGMLKTIRENSKHSLPMRTFEVSDVAFKDEVTDPQRCARNERHVTAVYTNKSANFEIVHGLLDRLMRSLDVPHIGAGDKSTRKGYYLKASDNPTYFPGRAASIYYRAPPQAPATTDDLSSHGPPSAPILDSAVTSKAQSGSTDLEQPQTSTSEKVSEAVASTVESMGKALADILGGSSDTALARRMQAIGGKGDIEIGHIGVLHPEVLAAFDLDLPCSAMEFDLEVFL
jgi:phenylalanyl-tRNA synthetase beta chain